jgi:hypothetical protein
MTLSIHEQEDRDYEEGVAYTQWLIGRAAGLEGAPVRGEDGWSEELEAEREAIRRQLDGEV